MDNYYQAPYYYSTSPSSSSDLPYSLSQTPQQWQQPQYFEAPPVSYEQVPTYPEYCQQYDTYYPPQCQVPTNIPPVVQEEHPIDQYNYSKYPHRQLRRGAYSTFQTYQLTMRFLKNNTILKAERIEFGKYINLTETQIKVWFRNQRHEKKKRTKAPVNTSKPNAYQPY